MCHQALEGILTAKITSDNTNKIIVSQDFGGNIYSKNSMIIYYKMINFDDYTNENKTQNKLSYNVFTL